MFVQVRLRERDNILATYLAEMSWRKGVLREYVLVLIWTMRVAAVSPVNLIESTRGFGPKLHNSHPPSFATTGD